MNETITEGRHAGRNGSRVETDRGNRSRGQSACLDENTRQNDMWSYTQNKGANYRKVKQKR